MSKKKRAAKQAKKQERAALVSERTAAACDDFRRQFPSPYSNEDELERDQSARRLLISQQYPGHEPDYAPPVFYGDVDEMPTFQPWVLRFRDALAATELSVQTIDARVRYQLATLIEQRERGRGVAWDDRGLRPESLRVMGHLIRRLPLDWASNTPYESAAALEGDVLVLREAWRRHFKLEELPPDFLPSMFSEDEEGMVGADWMGVFRDLLVQKYGSLDVAEPRWRFTLMQLSGEIASRTLDGVPPSDDPGASYLGFEV